MQPRYWNTIRAAASPYLVNELDEKEKERYRILTRKGYVYDSFDDEENFDEKENTFYIEPDSSIVLILDFLVFIFSFYNLILIPLRLGYNEIYCFYGNFFNFWNILELFNITSASLTSSVAPPTATVRSVRPCACATKRLAISSILTEPVAIRPSSTV